MIFFIMESIYYLKMKSKMKLQRYSIEWKLQSEVEGKKKIPFWISIPIFLSNPMLWYECFTSSSHMCYVKTNKKIFIRVTIQDNPA